MTITKSALAGRDPRHQFASGQGNVGFCCAEKDRTMDVGNVSSHDLFGGRQMTTVSRHVYHLAGFDLARGDSHYRRFASQLEAFKRTWNVDVTLSEMTQLETGLSVSWTTRASGRGWETDAVHEILLWGDILRQDLTRPLTQQLVEAARAYLDFIVTGTALRYARASWRYAAFFAHPPIVIALVAGCVSIVAHLLAVVLTPAGLNPALIGCLSGIALFVGLIRLLDEPLRLQLLLEDWSFARAYVRRQRPDLDARLYDFAKLIVARTHEGVVDEIILVGHSVGAMLAIDALDRALRSDPGFARNGPPVCLLTVGSTIPKLTLHSNAGHLRDAVARVATEPAIAWTEIQSRDDFISFYKFDPVALQRLAGDRLNGKPVIRRVQIHDMMQPATFWRHRFSMLRIHYQCVMANDKPAPYDYFLAMCGPVLFARWTISPQGLLDFVAADMAHSQQSTKSRWTRSRSGRPSDHLRDEA